MFTLAVKTHIDSAHYLPGYKGKCSKVHGHRWEITVFIQSPDLNESDMVIDFNMVKDRLKEVCPDHILLNDIMSNPTAENMAYWLFRVFADYFDNERVTVIAVTVQETPECCATYSIKLVDG